MIEEEKKINGKECFYLLPVINQSFFLYFEVLRFAVDIFVVVVVVKVVVIEILVVTVAIF